MAEIVSRFYKLINKLTDRVTAVEEIANHYLRLTRPDTGRLNARATFHDQMADMFNLDELREICFELNVPFEALPGETITRKALELYQFVERRGDLYRLARVCSEKRPGGDWRVT